MQQLSTTDVAALGLAAVPLTLYATSLLCWVARTNWRREANSLAAKVRAVVAQSPSPSESELERVSFSKAQEARLTLARNFMSRSRHAGAACVAMVVLDTWYPSIRLSFVQEGVFLLGFFVASLLHCCPCLLNHRTRRLWQSLLLCFPSVLGGATVTAPDPGKFLALHSHMCWVWVTAVGCTFIDGTVTLFWIGVYLVVMCAQYYSLDAEDVGQFALIELGSGAALSGCIVVMEIWFVNQHRSTTEAMFLKETQSATDHLLRIFYDVVLELDSNLAVTMSAEQLALFLPRRSGSPGPQLLGTRLEDLLEGEEDRRLFTERMQQPPTEQKPTVEVMHLSMRYGSCDSISAELFSLQFPGFAGWRRLLGTREFCNDATAATQGSTELELPNELEVPSGVIAATVDSNETYLPVLSMTPGLQQVLGTVLQNCSIRQVVKDEDRFIRWFQTAANSHFEPDSQKVSPSSCQVQLRSRWGRLIQVQAECSLSFLEESSEEEDDIANLPSARLTFHNLQVRQRKAYRGSSASSDSGSSSHSSSGSTSSRRCNGKGGTPREPRRGKLRNTALRL